MFINNDDDYEYHVKIKMCFAAVHRLTGKPNSMYDAVDGDEDSMYQLN